MKYIYIIQSECDEARYYTGITGDIDSRLAKHNSGLVTHTSKFKPWKLKTFIAFTDEKKAVVFEKYLKSGSGRAFAKKRL